MRIQQRFTISDLTISAARDYDKNPQNNLQRYCKQLSKADYLWAFPKRARGTKINSNGFIRYKLLLNTGSIAPSIRNLNRSVYDHNTGEEFSI